MKRNISIRAVSVCTMLAALSLLLSGCDLFHSKQKAKLITGVWKIEKVVLGSETITAESSRPSSLPSGTQAGLYIYFDGNGKYYCAAGGVASSTPYFQKVQKLCGTYSIKLGKIWMSSAYNVPMSLTVSSTSLNIDAFGKLTLKAHKAESTIKSEYIVNPQ